MAEDSARRSRPARPFYTAAIICFLSALLSALPIGLLIDILIGSQLLLWIVGLSGTLGALVGLASGWLAQRRVVSEVTWTEDRVSFAFPRGRIEMLHRDRIERFDVSRVIGGGKNLRRLRIAYRGKLTSKYSSLSTNIAYLLDEETLERLRLVGNLSTRTSPNGPSR